MKRKWESIWGLSSNELVFLWIFPGINVGGFIGLNYLRSQ